MASERARLTVEDENGYSNEKRPFWSVTRNKIIVAIFVVCVIAAVVLTAVMVVDHNKECKPHENPCGEWQCGSVDNGCGSTVVCGHHNGGCNGTFVCNTTTHLCENPVFSLAEILSTENIVNHLAQFDSIAKSHNSRSVVDGYNASAEYVISQLTQHTDCDISRQYFVVPVYKQLSPPTLTQLSPLNLAYVLGVDFSGTRYGGNGIYNITGTAYYVSGGCVAQDYDEFRGITETKIAVVFNNAGNCTPYDRALLAEAAGAQAILVVNNRGSALANWRVRSVAWLGSEPLVQIPVLGLTYTVGDTLRVQNGTILQLSINTQVTLETTYNVLCLTTKGRNDSIVVVGAHLDGVPEGPGVNDNASGSASVLEIALQVHLSRLEHENKILFAFWGAEEIGLLGSRYFVHTLEDPTSYYTHNNTILNLNFDMLGSPNFIRYVYTASTIANTQARERSGNIQKVFEEYFDSKAIPYSGSTMTGGSDYFSFNEAGIPAGALATGAGGIKSEDDRVKYGGFANTPLDPCYHLYCDSKDNINKEVLSDMSKAAAYATQILAQKEDLVGFLSTPI